MKAACLILAALAVGASAAGTPTVAHGGGSGGRWRRPVTCPDQQCTVPAGGTGGDSDCVQCFPTFSSGAGADTPDPKQCNTPCTATNCFRCAITNPAQCTECANDGTNPFYLKADGTCAECTAENCATRGWGSPVGGCRAVDGLCKKCAKGFGRDASGACVACNENCVVCNQDDATMCFRCKPGFFWDAGAKACTSCNERGTTGCANCPAQDVCRECMIGYATTRVFRSRAVTCTPCTNPGCARCDTAGNCLACMPKGADGSFWVYDAVSKDCYGPFPQTP